MRSPSDSPTRCWSKSARFALLRSAAILVFVASLTPPLDAVGLPGSWCEVRSAHFVLVGNETEGTMRKVASHLERVRSLYAQVLPGADEARGSQLPVLVARDEQTLEVLVPSTVAAHGKAGNVGGVFFSRLAMDVMVVRAAYDLEADLQIVNHEYFHYLAKRAGLRLPTWLNEGMADFWSTARFTKDSTEIGKPIPYRLASLTESRRIPFEKLMQVDGLSPEYRKPGLTPILYGESWAIVHYSVLGDGSGERRRQLTRYQDAVVRGEDSLVAARAAFGDLEVFENQVNGYARRKLFKFARGAVVPPPPESSLSSKSLTEAEASATIALAQLHFEDDDVARVRLRAAISGAPDLPMTHLAAGLAALEERRIQESAREFELAAASPELGPMAPYGVAVATIARDGSKADLEKVEQWLLKAIAMEPTYTPAFSRLADVYLRRPGDEAQALAMIRKAQALAPNQELFNLVEARALDRSGDRSGAKGRIDRVVESGLASESAGYQNNLCWHGSLLGYAKEVMELCERAVAGSKGTPGVRDTRGLARALAGDLPGALEDFRAVVAAAHHDDREGFLARRRRWLAALESGSNPLTPEELQSLLDSPADTGLWGY